MQTQQTIQCTACHGSGKQDETRDEYGNTATCPECGGVGVVAVPPVDVEAALAADAEAVERLGALREELRGAAR